MGFLTLYKSELKRHKWGGIGIFLLTFLVSLCLCIAVSVHYNGSSYINAEMQRLGFGDLTVWVSDLDDSDALLRQLTDQAEIADATLAPLVFSGYSIGEARSDNEGQLIAYEGNISYRLLEHDFKGYRENVTIGANEIYVSPALHSMFEFEIGDEIRFILSRGGDEMRFVVAGYFEDPFMGSSMIDMKSFLISPDSYAELLLQIGGISPVDVLARSGAMVHIFGGALSGNALTEVVFTNQSLQIASEFSYTASTMEGFMLLLQRMAVGFLVAFAVVLLFVTAIVLINSITSAIRQDSKNMGILKSIGFTSRDLRLIQLLQYGTFVLSGIFVAFAAYTVLSRFIPSATITSTGLLIPAKLPIFYVLLIFIALLAALALLIIGATGKITGISPLEAIQSENYTVSDSRNRFGSPVTQPLGVFVALRQLSSGKRRYLGTLLIASVLVFFVLVVGRMNMWLGPSGEGLMDAFSAAAHDIGVQPLGEMNMTEVESLISSYSNIEDTYELAMQSVQLDGVELTANIIDEPSYFNILSGRTCTNENEIVITHFVAQDFGLAIGDTVQISSGGNSAEYTVAGIYQCANEMGDNTGMSDAGYGRIASLDGYIWCRHYILSDSSQNEEIMAQLQSRYRIEADIHTNSWSGLSGIVQTMGLITALMYLLVALFVLVATGMTTSKMVGAEQRDLAIYKTIGITSRSLRASFALRFFVVTLLGAMVGIVLDLLLANRLIGLLLGSFGIGNFTVAATMLFVITSCALIILLFLAFAYLFAYKIKAFSFIRFINN